MIKGQYLDNKGISLPIRTLMNKDKRKVIDIRRLFKLGYTRTYELLNNPVSLTDARKYQLAGYFGIDYLEFCAMLHYNVKKLTPEQSATLDSIVKKYSNENKTENK